MKLARTLVFGLVVVLGIAAIVQHRKVAQLRDEHAALQKQVSPAHQSVIAASAFETADHVQAAPLTEEERSELLRLRGELARSRNQNIELATARTENQKARAALERFNKAKASATADYWPKEAWKFAGFATPDTALQSSLWAANEGDLKTLATSVTGEMLVHLTTDLQSKSPNDAAIKAMDEVSGIKSVRVLNREPQGNDTVILTASIQAGNETQTGKLTLKKVDNQWKVAAFSP